MLYLLAARPHLPTTVTPALMSAVPRLAPRFFIGYLHLLVSLGVFDVIEMHFGLKGLPMMVSRYVLSYFISEAGSL